MEEFTPGSIVYVVRIEDSQTRPPPEKVVFVYEGTVTEDGKGVRLGKYPKAEVIAIEENKVFTIEDDAMAAASELEASLLPQP